MRYFLHFIYVLLIILLLPFKVMANQEQISDSFIRLEAQVNRKPNHYIEMFSAAENVANASKTERVFYSILLARLYFFRGDITLAQQQFAAAYQQLPNDSPLLIAYWQMYRSWFSLEEGDIPYALALIKASKATLTRFKDSDMLVRAKSIEGVLLLWQEDYSTSLATIESAYVEARRQGVSDIALLYVYDSLAAYYSTLSLYDKGVEYALLAKELALKQQDVLHQLTMYYTLCLIYTRDNQLQRAAQCYEEMIALSTRVKAPRFLFWAPAGKARVSIKLQQYDEAISLLDLAQSYQTQVIINPAHVIALYNNFARAYLGLAKTADALEYINKAEKVLDEYNQPLNNRYRRQTLALKARVYAQQKQFEKTTNTLWRFINLTEEAKETTQLRLEQVARSAFEAKQQQIKLQLADEQLKLQKITLDKLAKEGQLRSAYLIIGLLFFIGISVFTINQQRAYKRSQKRANTDPLTGAFNRRFILDFINDKLLNKQRAFSVAILDIDHFKAINDNYGHDIGDQALIACCQYFSMHVGASDVQFARFGGEEFIIVMPDFNLHEAKHYVAAMCQELKSQQLTSEKITITSSAGVAEMTSDLTLATVLKKADTMLYEAKNTGRDKVCA